MTYVFQCRSCRHEFEITATVAEYESRKAPACPECGRQESRRVYTPVLVMTGAGASGASEPRTGGGGCGCGNGGCGCAH